MIRHFTGWHMLITMLAMFGLVIGVNLLMAHYALSTFGGTVVDNSYVASQNYNRWLADARAQDALGWRAAATLEDNGRVAIRLGGARGPISARLTAVASHPLGRAPDQPLTFDRREDGNYLSTRPLPSGRWQLRIQVRSDDRVARFSERVGG